jgi:hypothetical protein
MTTKPKTILPRSISKRDTTPNPTRTPGFFACNNAALAAIKETMSKIDCLVYLKSKLENEFTKLTTGDTPNLPAAQNVQRLVTTAHGIDDGFFAIIAPLYEPISPKFMLLVKVLNEGIVNGTASAASFDEYVRLLVIALQT